ncbi:MAG: tetratricopeptide repeat protein [Cetobacterium sp.]|uniref:tetratricopeptide repeat protein n=1 Tax=Cetobacterium sp. TaxID=2071632 RepID=UPI003F3CB764
MWKYLFLVFMLSGCSNNKVVKTTKNLETKNEKYLLLKGANLYSLGKKSEALETYKEILQINSKNSVALREKAIIEGQLGDTIQAEKDLNSALALNPKDNLTLKNLGYLNFEKRNYNKSSKYLKSVSKDFMNDQDYFILGYIEFLNGNYLNSLKYYEYVENDEIFNNSLFFDSYLNNLKRIENLKKDSYLKIEDKIRYNKINTIKLSNFYSSSLEKDDYSERVLKNYLAYNEIDKDIVEELINIYYKNGDKVKEKKALNLILN